MRRRALFVGIAGAALLWPIAAGTQKSIQIIGFLNSASPEAYTPMNAAFRTSLTLSGHSGWHMKSDHSAESGRA